MPAYETVEKKINEIEAEMKKIGIWQAGPIAPEKLKCKKAFCMDTMSFEEWLQYVLVPRVRSIIAEKGEWPKGSAVGVMAIRNFDGFDEAGRLAELLNEFDRLFD
jgi:uncharacterized protein YqcC (DUF446 family)